MHILILVIKRYFSLISVLMVQGLLLIEGRWLLQLVILLVVHLLRDWSYCVCKAFFICMHYILEIVLNVSTEQQVLLLAA